MTGLGGGNIDFRTVHVGGARIRFAAQNIDRECTRTTLCDYLRASDFRGCPIRSSPSLTTVLH